MSLEENERDRRKMSGIWLIWRPGARGWYIKGFEVVVGGKLGGFWVFSL